MSHWDDIRAQARARRAAASDTLGPIPAAEDVLREAQRLTGVPCKGLRAGHRLLDGAEAVFDATYGETGVIWFNKEVKGPRGAFYRAHEYAHVWLHRDYAQCSGSDLDSGNTDAEGLSGAQRVEGYSLRERREREANVFAHEFLLPADALRRWFLVDRLGAEEIARRVGVEPAVVYHQIAHALLVPVPPSTSPSAHDDPPPDPTYGPTVGRALPAPVEGSIALSEGLDPSQDAAAHVAHGPFLLEAGPGTGKTRTLVARVTHLLDQGVAPSAILALTFSNKAAEEMRERVARVAPEAAPRLWMGTFHAFGLELLRKYGASVGLDRPAVLDLGDTVALLEQGLAELDLDHYQNLYQPTLFLPDILAAISRAKDELVGADDYACLAEAMRQAAVATGTPEDIERAERALEVARAYASYQAVLERTGQLDFGDLIARAVGLLRAHPEIRAAVRHAYRHVLVDEYQDVNRASAVLLREVAGEGQGLWVVGDARQAIYRFRGAAPSNMTRFADDFPDAAVRTLDYNYRSRPAIVAAVASLAPRMMATAGQPFTPWHAMRPDDGGSVRMVVTDDDAAEGAAMAAEIERQRAAGVAYRDQAVLCRSHTTMARTAAGLEAAGVPVLYLGNLFERPEVRDLLALLSLACAGPRHGLLRVARFPEYDIPLADVHEVFARMRDEHLSFGRALKWAATAATVSPRGRQGAARLRQHLAGLGFGKNAWRFLVAYLFDRASYVRDALGGDTLAARQRRLAVYQLLRVAFDQGSVRRERGVDPKRAFLDYVRRLEVLGEERAFRQIPDWAAGLDAVRLLTVHGSKGLEFSAVYVPALAQTYFPVTERRPQCPPPTGMLPVAVSDSHREEEECLFFVALSRARDTLFLSRARRYGQTARQPSDLLSLVAAQLPEGALAGGQTSKAPEMDEDEDDDLPPLEGPKPVLPATVVEIYMRCPRRYYYEIELGLGGRQADSAYMQFHRCVYATVRWIRAERAAGRAVDDAAAQAHLAEVWAEQGPRDHAYAALYQQKARSMVARAVDQATASSWGRSARPDWEVSLRHGRVSVTPDHVEVIEESGQETVVVQRMRTGRASKTERDDPIYGLYARAAQEAYPDARRRVQTVYLSSGETEDVALKDRPVRTRLKKYDAAFAGIIARRFPARPDARECPRCPFYFICPTGDESSPASNGG